MKKAAFIIVLSIILLFSACSGDLEPVTVASDTVEPVPSSTEADAVSEATLARYQENEIMDYQGIRLDPVIGPRDNSIKGVQYVDIDSYTLEILGLVDEPISFTYDEILAMPSYEKVITLHCVEGWDATVLWKGVKIEDILKEAGADFDAATLIFVAADDYLTSMPLSTVLERDMILAYEANGNVLPPEMGYPFIVVAEDKLGYKWARWVTKMEVSNDEKFAGFWESNGFGNDAEVPDSRKDGN